MIEIDLVANYANQFYMLHFCRKNLGVSVGQFSQMEDEEVEDMLEEELWKKDKFKVWKEEKDAEMRVKMAQSGRYLSLIFF